MASQHDYLGKVGEEGFSMLQRQLASQGQGHLYDHQDRYIYKGPEVYTVMMKEPAFTSINLQATKFYDGRYARQAPQVPARKEFAAMGCNNEVAQRFEGRHAYQVPEDPPVQAAAAPKRHDAWYIVKAPEVPAAKDQSVINSDMAAEKHGGIVIKEYGFIGKPKPNGWGYY